MMGAESLGKKSVQNASQAARALEQRCLPLDTSFAEKHYRDSDLAKLWALGKETVRKLVKDDPDVIRTDVPPLSCLVSGARRHSIHDSLEARWPFKSLN